MTRDEIINLMHETECLDEGHYGSLWMDRFERFAALVAAAEREACAQECENQKVGLPSYFEIDERIQWCAVAIRARSNL